MRADSKMDIACDVYTSSISKLSARQVAKIVGLKDHSNVGKAIKADNWEDIRQRKLRSYVEKIDPNDSAAVRAMANEGAAVRSLAGADEKLYKIYSEHKLSQAELAQSILSNAKLMFAQHYNKEARRKDKDINYIIKPLSLETTGKIAQQLEKINKVFDSVFVDVILYSEEMGAVFKWKE